MQTKEVTSPFSNKSYTIKKIGPLRLGFILQPDKPLTYERVKELIKVGTNLKEKEIDDLGEDLDFLFVELLRFNKGDEKYREYMENFSKEIRM